MVPSLLTSSFCYLMLIMIISDTIFYLFVAPMTKMGRSLEENPSEAPDNPSSSARSCDTTRSITPPVQKCWDFSL